MAREGLAERLTEAGRTATFRFAEPTDERPCILAGNVKSYGMFWQEWIHGIAGNKPARLWGREERGQNSKFSKRKPIYLLLDRMVHYGKKSPPEAFRVLEMHFPGKNFGTIAEEIRKRELNGTLHPDLADPHHPLQLQRPKKRRRRNA